MFWWILLGALAVGVIVVAIITMDYIINKVNEEKSKLGLPEIAFKIKSLLKEGNYNKVNIGLYKQESGYMKQVGEITIQGEEVAEEVKRNIGVYYTC